MPMDDYANRNIEAKGFGVARPSVDKTKSFEIKGQFLNMLSKLEFSGMNDDDPNFHVTEVVEITDFFNFPNVTEDQVMLRMFPATLKGNVNKWLFSVPSTERYTWAKLKAKFIRRFSPPTRIAKKKVEIETFKQEGGETLYDAWDRFKKLLIECPQHDLIPQQEMSIFYNGLDRSTRCTLDAQGPLTKKNPIEARELVEELA